MWLHQCKIAIISNSNNGSMCSKIVLKLSNLFGDAGSAQGADYSNNDNGGVFSNPPDSNTNNHNDNTYNNNYANNKNICGSGHTNPFNTGNDDYTNNNGSNLVLIYDMNNQNTIQMVGQGQSIASAQGGFVKFKFSFLCACELVSASTSLKRGLVRSLNNDK